MDELYKPMRDLHEAKRKLLWELAHLHVNYMRSIDPEATQRRDDVHYVVSLVLSGVYPRGRYATPRWRDEPNAMDKRREFHYGIISDNLMTPYRNLVEYYELLMNPSNGIALFARQCRKLVESYERHRPFYPASKFEAVLLCNNDLLATVLGDSGDNNVEAGRARARAQERESLRQEIENHRNASNNDDIFADVEIKKQTLESRSKQLYSVVQYNLDIHDITSLSQTCKSASESDMLDRHKPRLRFLKREEVAMMGEKFVDTNGKVHRADSCVTPRISYIPSTPRSAIKVNRMISVWYQMIKPVDDAAVMVYKMDLVKADIEFRMSLVYAKDDTEIDPTVVKLVGFRNGVNMPAHPQEMTGSISTGPLYAQKKALLREGVRLKVAPAPGTKYADVSTLTGRSDVFTLTKGWAAKNEAYKHTSRWSGRCNAKDQRVLHHRVLEKEPSVGDKRSHDVADYGWKREELNDLLTALS